MEKISEDLKSKIKEKLRKQASALTPLIVNPAMYGLLGAGVGGTAAGIKAMYEGAPFEYGFRQGVVPGVQAGAVTGGLMGLGPAIMRAQGKNVPAYNPITGMNIIPAAVPEAMAGWQSIPSYG